MEVEVDTETGEIEVTKVVNVNDVGKAINPEARRRPAVRRRLHGGEQGRRRGGVYGT